MRKAIITDIEGTVCPIAFVTNALYPYARRHLAEFIRAHAREPAVQAQLAEIDRLAGRALSLEEAIAQLFAWMDEDRKITPLKALQGMVWEGGFAQGELLTPLYPDVAPQLAAWQRAGIRLYVYSSGSVQAQRLIFAHTTSGDLTPLFSGYFDTTIGGKKEPASYRRIAEAVGLPPHRIVFLSDAPAELDAAHQAGVVAIGVVREGPIEHGVRHRQVRDFTAVDALLR